MRNYTTKEINAKKITINYNIKLLIWSLLLFFIKKATAEMKKAAKDLNFKEAARLRDEIKELGKMIN